MAGEVRKGRTSQRTPACQAVSPPRIWGVRRPPAEGGRPWSWGRKPDSVPRLAPESSSFLSDPLRDPPSQARGRAQEDATYPGLLDGPSSPLFCLAPDWVFPAAGIAAGAVGSYPTFSPLPSGSESAGEVKADCSTFTFPRPFHSNRQAVFSLWHCPSRRLDPPRPGLSRSASGRRPCGQPGRRDSVSRRESCPRVSGLSSPNRLRGSSCPERQTHWARVYPRRRDVSKERSDDLAPRPKSAAAQRRRQR